MSECPLRNAAYSDLYKEQTALYDKLFSGENEEESEVIILSDKYKITKTTYAGVVNNLNLSGNFCLLSDNKGYTLHSWKNYDNDAEFHTIVNHKNGNKYLVYRQELYGYSVYDLTNNKEFQYYPQCVLDGCEYFIWTEINYNPLNNLLAVNGCIWACPNSTLIVDFADPMTEPDFQFDVIECLDSGYDTYDDADFVKWDEEKIVLNCYNTVTNSKEEITLLPENYLPKDHPIK